MKEINRKNEITKQQKESAPADVANPVVGSLRKITVTGMTSAGIGKDPEPTGKDFVKYQIWNGVGWATIVDNKDEIITFHE
jgi:hypothetical protein